MGDQDMEKLQKVFLSFSMCAVENPKDSENI